MPFEGTEPPEGKPPVATATNEEQLVTTNGTAHDRNANTEAPVDGRVPDQPDLIHPPIDVFASSVVAVEDAVVVATADTAADPMIADALHVPDTDPEVNGKETTTSFANSTDDERKDTSHNGNTDKVPPPMDEEAKLPSTDPADGQKGTHKIGKPSRHQDDFEEEALKKIAEAEKAVEKAASSNGDGNINAPSGMDPPVTNTVAPASAGGDQLQALMQTAAAAASSKHYGGTYPFYTAAPVPGTTQSQSQEQTPQFHSQAFPTAMVEGHYGIPRPSSTAPSPRQFKSSPQQQQQQEKEAEASPNPQTVMSYSSYPPVHAPSTSEIVSAIPENASSVFHILDRRINFDKFPSDASFYSLLRGWVWDDPYRSNLPVDTLLSGGAWATLEDAYEVSDGSDASKKRKRRTLWTNDERMKTIDVLGIMKNFGERPAIGTLSAEHVARAKRKRSDTRRLDQEKMERARKSLQRKYGVTL